MAAVIDGPLPVPPRLSLLDAADMPQDDLAKWMNPYVRYQPSACEGTGAFVFDPCAVHTKPEGERVPEESIKPFGVGYAFQCNTLSGYTPGDFRAMARREFEAWQPKLIEREVWSAAAITTNPDLVGADTIVAAGVAGLAPITALACLEQTLRECGSGAPGFVHATPHLVTEWKAAGAVDRANRWKGDLVYTVLDDVVVPGSGYDGSPPAGQSAQVGVEWAYATQIVAVRLSPITFVPSATLDDRQWMREAIDRTDNTIKVVVERAALVVWDPCCTIAVRVNVQGCSVGS